MRDVFTPEHITEEIAYATVRIDTNDGSGSGFFYKKKYGGKELHVIVTNKHVIKKSKEGQIRFHLKKDEQPTGDLFSVKYENFESLWICHPDPKIDLCIFPIGPLIHELKKEQNKSIYYRTLDNSLIPNKETLKSFSYVENILMAGYPRGLADEINNYPIIRQGVTATHLAIPFGGKPEFVIDAACFPGSSGSPVFLLRQGAYCDKKGNTHIGSSQCYFLGVLYAGPQAQASGKVQIEPIPTNYNLVTEMNYMMHLGYVIRSSKVEEIFDEIKDIT